MTKLNRANKRDVKKSTTIPVAEKIMAAAVASLPPVPESITDWIDFTKLPYRKLQAMAQEMGLKSSGTKIALIARIQGR